MSQTIKLKLTALTPLHIGTGEDYEPTNFVIDNGYLYEFDEIKFFEKLSGIEKERFLKAVEKKGPDSLFEIHRVIKQNKKEAIASAQHKVQVSKGIERDYENKVGKAVQQEGGRRIQPSKVFNRFQIARTIRQPNNKNVYIPGSSFKGAISTAYQELWYKRDSHKWREFFQNRRPQENIFKNLVVADTMAIKTYAMVGYALNKERFEEDQLGPSNKLETIYKGSEFETTLKIRDYKSQEPVDFELIKKSCDAHYLPLFQQMFKPFTTFKGKETDDFTNEYFDEKFYETYKDFKLKENQFLIRVGKHSGARAVTIDGMRQIKVKISGGGPKRKPNRWETLDQETTIWMYAGNENALNTLLPFGWVLCEVK